MSEEFEVRNCFSRPVSRTVPVGKSRTKQSMRDECDVNFIVRKWQKGATIGHLAAGEPLYGDFTNATDYLDALTRVQAAEEQFMALPSAIRNVCENDPAQLLELLGDPDRREIVEELGLVELAEAIHGPRAEEPNLETAGAPISSEDPSSDSDQ